MDGPTATGMAASIFLSISPFLVLSVCNDGGGGGGRQATGSDCRAGGQGDGK